MKKITNKLLTLLLILLLIPSSIQMINAQNNSLSYDYSQSSEVFMLLYNSLVADYGT